MSLLDINRIMMGSVIVLFGITVLKPKSLSLSFQYTFSAIV